MRVKKQFRNLRPDYEIFLWIKSFECTGTTQYKNESQLLHEFKQLHSNEKRNKSQFPKQQQTTQTKVNPKQQSSQKMMMLKQNFKK
ncbi:hypothetical protein F8M41_020177 [Gigaspora margarita]|uniref:Uncharacterized protein n=1 Tax=Gigaspora margarita TaxID=4874 RepID=A0A8H4EK22_GIGMA|nr:hypothetical protein F8M41_020177 [Gigaspora margarita]